MKKAEIFIIVCAVYCVLAMAFNAVMFVLHGGPYRLIAVVICGVCFVININGLVKLSTIRERQRRFDEWFRDIYRDL
jgi:fructose-specific phosphotransferase system IIC component